MIAKVLYNTNILPLYYRLGLGIDGFADCLPGQFVMLRVSNQLDPLLRRPFGIYKVTSHKLEILYKVVGKGTTIMSGLKKGDEVDVLGPLGNSFLLVDEYKNIIMVAGGIGIVPLYMQGLRLKAKGLRFKMLFGGRNKDDLPGLDDFKKLGIDVKISTDDGSFGEKGFVTGLLEKELSINRVKGQGSRVKEKTVVYACGSKPMLKAVAKIAEKNNIPCYISLDNVMACGMGACLGCAVKVRSQESVVGQGFSPAKATLKGCPTSLQPSAFSLYKMVCKDGPIFDTREIDWEKV